MSTGYERADTARLVEEYGKNPGRTAFERDRARLLHSSALRRLGAKTQVMGPGSDDFIRTRLTHSLEVAQIGREVGKALGCDPDVVETACLAHDLGHPPFGHNGERALAEATADFGGFEGNAQTLRLLTRLEPKIFAEDGSPAGLNLTRASLDATIKYPWSRDNAPLRPAGFPKFGFYADDAHVFDWIRAGAPTGVQCVEAQVMDLADDIAYSVHDVEDAIVARRFAWSDLERSSGQQRVVDMTIAWYGDAIAPEDLYAALGRLVALPYAVRGFDGTRADLAALKDMTSQLIGRFTRSAIEATRARHGDGPLTRYNGSLEVPADTAAEVLALKGAAAAYVMAPREREPIYAQQRQIIHDLVRYFGERAPSGLEAHFAQDWRRAHDEVARQRVIADQVASLTDISAQRLHQRFSAGLGA